MARKRRILLLEDVRSVRQSYVSTLELEGYEVVAVGSLKEALDVLKERTFHIALVDIMLDGPKNTSNRDGVKAIEHINKMDEGTFVIPLTGQDTRSFVRDSFKTHEVADFLDKKEDIADKGWAFAIDRIEKALSKSELDDTPEWGDLSKSVFFNDEEQQFVSNVGKVCGRVPFDLLRRLFCSSIRQFQPLVGKPGLGANFRYDNAQNCLLGEFWSKAVGSGVEFIVRKPQKGEEDEFSTRTLFYRRKGNLEVLVQKTDSKRDQFLG